MSSIELHARIAAENQLAAAGLREASRVLQGSSLASVEGGSTKPGLSFASVLASTSASDRMVFSAHAQTRLASRGISLTAADVFRLNQAVDAASAKGAKSSLVLMDRPGGTRIGLVVSVTNRTVITAVDTQSLKDNVFTNIDSAVIV